VGKLRAAREEERPEEEHLCCAPTSRSSAKPRRRRMSESPKSLNVRLSPDDAMRLVEKEAVGRQLDKSAEMCEEVLAELARLRNGSSLAGSGRIARRGSQEQHATRATVGLILIGRQVFGVLPGGPASVAGITRGDILLMVDGTEVTNETARDAVVGDDVVGSRMMCSVMKDSGDKRVVEVGLERMDSRQVKCINFWVTG
jgi:C-terminal processing protease CtpA/Prc